MEEKPDWSTLPDLLLTQVMKYLPSRDRLSAGSTCTTWYDSAHQRSMWSHYTFTLEQPGAREVKPDTEVNHDQIENTRETSLRIMRILAGAEALINHHKEHLHDITLKVDKTSDLCSRGLVELIKCMTNLKEFGFVIHRLSIIHTNYELSFKPQPELEPALIELFKVQTDIYEVDLSRYQMSISDTLLTTLYRYLPNMKNAYLTSKVETVIMTQPVVIESIKNWKNLEIVRLPYYVCGNELIEMLSELGRHSLYQLELSYTSSDKMRDTMYESREYWKHLFDRNPRLHMTLSFTESAYTNYVMDAVRLEFLRVNKLSLNTYTPLQQPLSMVADNFSSTLEYLEIASTDPCEELYESLIQISTNCTRLKQVVIKNPVSWPVITDFIRKHSMIKPGFRFYIDHSNTRMSDGAKIGNAWVLVEIAHRDCDHFTGVDEEFWDRVSERINRERSNNSQ